MHACAHIRLAAHAAPDRSPARFACNGNAGLSSLDHHVVHHHTVPRLLIEHDGTVGALSLEQDLFAGARIHPDTGLRTAADGGSAVLCAAPYAGLTALRPHACRLSGTFGASAY